MNVTDVLARAAAGDPPPPDGGVDVVPAPPGPAAAVLAFPAHHVVAADVDPAWVHEQLPPGDLGAPLGAPFLLALAARTGRRVGTVDVVLAAPAAAGDPPLDLRRIDDADHPRVQRAHRYRDDVGVWEAGGGLLVVGRGFAGRWEAAFEVEPHARGRGLGRSLAAAARHLVDPGAPVWAQVAPGNSPSLRAVLAAGYAPVGAEVLLPAADLTPRRRG